MIGRCARLVAALVTLAAGTAVATPAAAAVTYDPGTRTGSVAAADVRRAFGWSRAQLAARAATVVFDHDFREDDHYSAGCGKRVVPLVHHRVYGRYELAGEIVRAGGSRNRTGYAPGVAAFRLTGARAGISGTSVAPEVGQPCPGGSRIDRLRLVSTVTGWTLTVHSGDLSRQLLTGS